jgi:hypothetical protein
MEMTAKVLETAILRLNAASLPCPVLFQNIPEGQLDGKNYFPVENIQVIAEGELFNRFAI